MLVFIKDSNPLLRCEVTTAANPDGPTNCARTLKPAWGSEHSEQAWGNRYKHEIPHRNTDWKSINIKMIEISSNSAVQGKLLMPRCTRVRAYIIYVFKILCKIFIRVTMINASAKRISTFAPKTDTLELETKISKLKLCT